MTKKTIMQSLKEAEEKAEAEGNHLDLDRLFGRAADENDEDSLCFESIEQYAAIHTLDTLERIANALEENEHGGENMDQDILTRKQAMETLNVKDYRTLNKLIKDGLPVIRVGSYVRFSKTDISEFLEEHKER